MRAQSRDAFDRDPLRRRLVMALLLGLACAGGVIRH